MWSQNQIYYAAIPTPKAHHQSDWNHEKDMNLLSSVLSARSYLQPDYDYDHEMSPSAEGKEQDRDRDLGLIDSKGQLNLKDSGIWENNLNKKEGASSESISKNIHMRKEQLQRGCRKSRKTKARSNLKKVHFIEDQVCIIVCQNKRVCLWKAHNLNIHIICIYPIDETRLINPTTDPYA